MSDIKVGVLLPRSSLYSFMGGDVFNALKAGLKHLGITSVQFCTENIGFGGSAEEVYSKAEKMLLQDDPQLVIAFLDHYAAAKIEELFNGHNKMLLVLDPGGHVADVWDVSPLRFTISLQAALGSRLMARMAVEQGAKKNIFATSFYEGGYLGCYSCLRGMEKAGGQVYYNDVVPYKLETYSPERLKQAIGAIQPDAVLAQFSIEAGGLFLSAYADAGLNTKIYGSPLMFEEEWLSKQPFNIEGITGVAPWARGLDNEENRVFMEKIEAAAGRSANVFHLLGWEAALFCEQFIKAFNEHEKDIRGTAAALETAVLDSPRGRLVMDRKLHYFFGPMYEVQLASDEKGMCRVEVKGAVPFTEEECKFFVSEPPQGIISRWTNTYLCI